MTDSISSRMREAHLSFIEAHMDTLLTEGSRLGRGFWLASHANPNNVDTGDDQLTEMVFVGADAVHRLPRGDVQKRVRRGVRVYDPSWQVVVVLEHQRGFSYYLVGRGPRAA